MRTLDHKIPPPAVGLLLAGAMWGVSLITPAIQAAPYSQIAAAIVALIGVGFDIAGIVSFRRAKTTVNPLRPNRATALVSSGIFRITRNPMYVGMLFILVSWALFLSSVWTLFGPIAFWLYMNRFQISPEERVLAELFGSDFADYKKRVRRWL